MDRNLVLATISILAAAFIAASVFAYYPIQLVIQPTQPPIKFAAGSNAGSPDLGAGNTIAVSIGSNSTWASVTVHPTYRTTYYKNITLIVNEDNKQYNVSLVIASYSNTLPADSKIYLIVYNSGAQRSLTGWPAPQPQVDSYVKIVDLTDTSTNRKWIGRIDGNGKWEVDLLVYIPEGSSITNASATFNMYLVYSPSSETPPQLV